MLVVIHFQVLHETQDPVSDRDMKTLERNETFISFKCFQSTIKHMEQVFHMTYQPHEQTGVQVLFSVVGLIIQMAI